MPEIFVIAFTIAGCPPCDSFKAISQAEMEGVRIVVVDAKEDPKLAERCNVGRMPTFVAISDGQVTARMIGFQSEKSLRVWLRKQQLQEPQSVD